MGEALFLAGMSLLVGLACLGILVWALFMGEGLTLDGLLLAAVCLTLGMVFLSFGAWIFRSSGVLAWLRSRGAQARKGTEAGVAVAEQKPGSVDKAG